MLKLSEIVKLYASKRRGEDIKESFEQLKRSFKASVENLIEEKNTQEIFLEIDQPYAKELFDKYSEYTIVPATKESTQQFIIKMKESAKKVGDFIYFKQWWKGRNSESAILADYVIGTNLDMFIHFDKDILCGLRESVIYFQKTDFLSTLTESAIFIPPRSPGNGTVLPSWIKKLAEGKISITDSSELHRIIELSGSGMDHRISISRKDENSDFWSIDKESMHAHDKCMECDSAPKYELLWAEGMGHAWFCESHFKSWSTEHKTDICSVKEIKDGKAADKFAENTNPNIKEELLKN